MFMETVTCGYPAGSSSLRVGSPLSPPATPTADVGYSHSPECSPQLYADTHYDQTGYSSEQLSTDISNSLPSSYEDDANNNNNHHALSECHEDLVDNGNLVNGFSALHISESERKSSPKHSSSRRVKKSSKSSKSNRNANSNIIDDKAQDEKKPRKDSFVYDVRLPDEQFLFFVPDLDLVKSHLMFAVREEVEVLKEKIVDLLDRIHNLECENTLLRQYAPQEALQQIQQQLQQQLPPAQQQLPQAQQQQQQQQQQQPTHHISS